MKKCSRASRQVSTVTLVYVLVALLVLASACGAKDLSLADKLDQYLNASADVWKFQGAALIADDGEVILKKGYGMANIELDVPNTPANKFLIGSITKQFTATAIMQLVEQGLVKLDAPLTTYLTDYPAETGDKITIHHLLRHTAGVPSYTGMPDVMGKVTQPTTLEELIATFKDKPLEFEPGENYNYSNSGYVLLGAVIEKVSGMSYEDYLRKHIFDAVGMSNSGYGHQDIIITGRASGYFEDGEDKLCNATVLHMSWPYAAGALYSTVEDMLRWDQSLYSDKVLNQSSLEQMFTPGLSNYGYGWGIRELFGRKLVRHNGGIDGFHSSFFRWIDDGVCVVVFSNNINAPASDIATGLSAIVLGEPYDLPVIKTPVEIDPQILADYQGAYRIDSSDCRVVTVEDGKIYAKRTGGQRRELLPESEDKFFYEHNHVLTLQFVRDAAGSVTHHIMHQNCLDEDPAEKLSEAESEKLLAPQEVADVDPAIYDDYVGEYRLMPGFSIVVTRRGDKLITQATDQDEVEVFPKSETRFFMKIVDAEIEFVRDDSGQVVRAVVHQGGREMPAEKIK